MKILKFQRGRFEMLIDEKLLDDIDKITTEKYGGVSYVHIPLLSLRNLILSRRVPMKSPEQIERAIKDFDNYPPRGVLRYKHLADFLRAVLNQPQDTWDDKIFEKEGKSDEKVD